MNRFFISLFLLLGLSALLLSIDLGLKGHAEFDPFIAGIPFRVAALGLIVGLFTWRYYSAVQRQDTLWLKSIDFYLRRLPVLYFLMLAGTTLLLALPLVGIYEQLCCSALDVALYFSVVLAIFFEVLMFVAGYGWLVWKTRGQPFRIQAILFSSGILIALILIFPKLLLTPVFLADFLFNEGKLFS